MSLVSTQWLDDNLSKVKVFDASWHLVKNRNAFVEYQNEHLENVKQIKLWKHIKNHKHLRFLFCF